MSPAAPHSPAACSRSISAKSSESSRIGAEWNPPSRSRTRSFAIRYQSSEDSPLMPPRTPIVFTHPL